MTLLSCVLCSLPEVGPRRQALPDPPSVMGILSYGDALMVC